MSRKAPTAESYDHYYGSGLYDARYPRPNPPTYRTALRLAAASSRILDFGAGSGRYTLPLLQATNAFICAYDISTDACRSLVRTPALAPADDLLRRLLPAWAGYGLRATCRPTP